MENTQYESFKDLCMQKPSLENLNSSTQLKKPWTAITLGYFFSLVCVIDIYKAFEAKKKKTQTWCYKTHHRKTVRGP